MNEPLIHPSRCRPRRLLRGPGPRAPGPPLQPRAPVRRASAGRRRARPRTRSSARTGRWSATTRTHPRPRPRAWLTTIVLNPAGTIAAKAGGRPRRRSEPDLNCRRTAARPRKRQRNVARPPTLGGPGRAASAGVSRRPCCCATSTACPTRKCRQSSTDRRALLKARSIAASRCSGRLRGRRTPRVSSVDRFRARRRPPGADGHAADARSTALHPAAREAGARRAGSPRSVSLPLRPSLADARGRPCRCLHAIDSPAGPVFVAWNSCGVSMVVACR